jgi:hypothetical protein
METQAFPERILHFCDRASGGEHQSTLCGFGEAKKD